ncbi:GNAT family N-acetyltransferase [Chelatococcus sp. GCM10030263]|uniref:GNAT family N-acetyltransferase n=1 Tax=Chelatococcus sp. GCM10030263 TaxID=3273387 RepID=UPI00360C9558
MIETAVVDSEADLRALEPEWWDLWGRSASATPFQSPAWAMPWWEAFAPGRLHVVTLRRRGELVGLAPFYVDPERRALPIGIAASDYLDVLIDPKYAAPVTVALDAEIARGLGAGMAEWEMPDLPPEAQAFGLSPDADTTIEPGQVCPVLPLPAGAVDLSSVIPARKWRKLRMARNRARRLGGGSISCCHGAGLAEAFAALVELHGLRWEERGGGVLADPRVRLFHQRALPELDRAGLLELLVCRIGGDIVGVYYGLKDRSRSYAYIGGFDPAQAFVSPGTLLIGHALDRALSEGRREFHFLRGREGYKYEWGAVDRLSRRRVFRPAPAYADA